jgi:hypothetical protein
VRRFTERRWKEGGVKTEMSNTQEQEEREREDPREKKRMCLY